MIRLLTVLCGRAFFFLLVVFSHAMATDTESLPYPANVVLYKADQLLGKQDPAGAARVLMEFIAQRPEKRDVGDSDPNGYFHHLVDFTLGNCYLMRHQLSLAIAFFRSSLERHPGFSPAWLNMAKAYYDQGRFADAARCYGRSYETAEKKQPDMLYYAASSYMSSGDHHKAFDTFQRLFRDHGKNSNIQWQAHFVHVCLAIGKPRDALPHLELLAEITDKKEKEQWQEILLNQYIILEMKTRALDYARHLTRQEPMTAKWWKSLVYLHLEEKRYAQALSALMIYGYLVPLSSKEIRLLADLNFNLGIPVQAARYFEQLFAAEKDLVTIKRLALSYMGHHRPDQALRVIEKGLVFVNDMDLFELKGEILYGMGRYPDAVTVFEVITAKMPSRGKAWLLMGYAALNMEDFQKAIYAFKKASQYPKYEKTAKKMLKSLIL